MFVAWGFDLVNLREAWLGNSMVFLRGVWRGGWVGALFVHFDVECVAEAVSEEVYAEDCEGDGDAGEEHDVGGCLEAAAAVVEHASPFGEGGLYAEV